MIEVAALAVVANDDEVATDAYEALLAVRALDALGVVAACVANEAKDADVAESDDVAVVAVAAFEAYEALFACPEDKANEAVAGCEDWPTPLPRATVICVPPPMCPTFIGIGTIVEKKLVPPTVTFKPIGGPEPMATLIPVRNRLLGINVPY